ncbi:carboxylesterase family protein [Stieleria varia]|uniref:Esterase n=1 Tax=Stieleria varia TaxID=2528005 RepID=A0A5C5ZZG0_9BACT|nr:alpha/beta hydrolase-fold protein [Stieleria varia]TWT92447.1 esterase [Stieleria varia]
MSHFIGLPGIAIKPSRLGFFPLLGFVAALTCLLSPGVMHAQSPAESSANRPDANRPDKETVLTLYHAHQHRGETGQSLSYRIMSPAVIEPGKRYPLVLFLHGAGERGSDNAKQLVHGAAEFARDDRRQQYPAFVVFPQCPTDDKWVNVNWSEATGKRSLQEEASSPMQLTIELVQSLQETLPVDPQRVYVTGLSMGGFGTWYAAAHHSQLFAAAAPVCGGGIPAWAPLYNGIPVWAFHGGADSVVPVNRSREMISALALAGHTPEVRYVEYPGVNHDSWSATFARDDFFQWLFSQERK